MAVERSEFEFEVRTALELEGAEEGAGELARAVGKARALGRDSARLERQLARVRHGLRHFRLAHPELGEEGAENRKEKEVIEGEAGKEWGTGSETEAANGGAVRGPEGRRQEAVKEIEEDGGATGGQVAMEEEGDGSAPWTERGEPPEAAPAGGTGDVMDDVDGVNAAETDGAERAAAETAGIAESEGAAPGSAPDGDGGTDETEAVTAAVEPVMAVWTAKAQRLVEEMVRQALLERETAQPGMENSEEEQMAALELRLRRLEERGRMNREAG